MRSSRGRDGHGTIAYQQLLRHSAEISSVATVFAAEISHEENGKSTIVISEHCTEDELKKAHEAKDMDAIDSSLEKLNEAWSKSSEQMYAQSNEEQTADVANEDIQDIEAEEVS